MTAKLRTVNPIPNFTLDPFFPSITVQDFAIRGHQVYLHIKRRGWLNTNTGKVAYRDWSLVAEGTRMTAQIRRFFKRD